MKDVICVRFLQWALPHLHMRWSGFRKVRKQVCKRIQRRISSLQLTDVDAYQQYLQSHEEEWHILDHACRVTVSRFYRDKVVLEHIRHHVLPAMAQAAIAAHAPVLRGWSAGCAMGEEAYTLALIWDKDAGKNFPRLDIHVTATDIDEILLQRARRGCYSYGSIKALPEGWLQSSFKQLGNEYCIHSHFLSRVNFIKQDIRDQLDSGPFHIVFCRNMAFTYFEYALQLEILTHIHNNLVDGGALIIGGHESLPEGFSGFEQCSKQRAIFIKQPY